METILVRPRTAGQRDALLPLFREMGVPFEEKRDGAPAAGQGMPLEALKSIAGLLKDEIGDEEFEEMLREVHR